MSAWTTDGAAPRFLRDDQFLSLLHSLQVDHELFVPVRSGDAFEIARFDPAREPAAFEWNDLRCSTSLKGFWFQPAKILARWPGENLPKDDEPEDPPVRSRVIVGAKACDVRALLILDRVLRDHTFREPAYCERREKNFVISGDCTTAGDSCFCTMLGDLPHPTEGFDLNLSPVPGGYVVEVGSDKGEKVVAEHGDLFTEARREQIDDRDQRREEQVERVRALCERFPVKDPFSQSIQKNLNSAIWGELAATCVECNACNLNCPTCHCFLVHDTMAESGPVRVSLWDSCFFAGHARMAGGGTPRLLHTERFRNHYFHKFVSFPENWGVTACTGCGRCIDACLGGIDKRDCLHQLETRWIPSEASEVGG